MSTETERAEQVRAFFDRIEQDPRTPAELDAIQAQAWEKRCHWAECPHGANCVHAR